MRVITLGDKQAIECGHCRGTAVCQKAEKISEEDGQVEGRLSTIYLSWNECPICGKGATRRNTTYLPNCVPLKCKVCDGKGYTVL